MTHQNLTRQRQTDLFLVHLLPKAALPTGEPFYSLAEARAVIESWRRRYDTLRPHSSLGCKPRAGRPALAKDADHLNHGRKADHALNLIRATKEVAGHYHLDQEGR